MAQVTVHASTVAFRYEDGACAVVLAGPSGCGKSSLALELMALGGWLVSDDQTKLHVADDILVATAPAQLAGLIEWRGVGLLPAATIDKARVVVWLDMTKRAAERMPPRRWTTCLGLQVPLLHMPDSPAVAAGLRHYIMSGAWHSPAEDER